MPVAPTPRISLSQARAAFVGGDGYLAACTVGLPTRATVAAVRADLDSSAAGRPDIAAYSAAVEHSRALFASLVVVAPERVAIGSQASAAAALVAAALPDGAEVLVPDGEFSSIVLPFVHAGRGIHVRTAPLQGLAEAIGAQTRLVAFSVVQSATGEVADVDAIIGAAARCGAMTLCDATQAVGWLPVEASRFDAVICHAYKWLCSPRGVSFLTVSDRLADVMPPRMAGWYAGDDPWASCYGAGGTLASGARRFDVSPAWQAFVGAAPALELFAALDPGSLHAHVTGLAAAFRAGMGLPRPQHPSAIATWSDPAGDDLARLTDSGIVASGRAGRARVAFHVFNDEADVDRAIAALRP
ncbi:aminotransferase class V-fold PLP-dependent enzyme [Microbacterium sp. HD4P20]|uniref:aminotransferase class V-fold PLP-dependent enzyme n=1 Tax=Microbacterium sp. HD4P20 TaxID=2864874 RepID=UPI001C63F819|nr:aminotransferase class V-fold PLP-dependent enzyme [Microbacterium sp. HD4P20]MCP2636632.1 aminotransferase class V-fold PLP-dependent enzyme [Microbacterium sp. HD4P20]